MKYRSSLLFSLSIFAFSFLIFNFALAQGLPGGISGIELTASSDSPNPGQIVTLTARSYNFDIDSSTLTWTINGKVIKKGVGETVLEVAAPALGKILDINISAVTSGGLMTTQSLKMSSGSVDMIIESGGHAPYFFQGKLPLVYQNPYTIIAMPHLADAKGVEYDPKTLTYKWKKNDQVIEDQSGYGKQTLSLSGDIVPRAFVVTVEVSNRDNTAHAVGYQNVAFNSPSIAFYIDDPLYGTLFNTAVTEAINIGTQKEKGVLAIPFGFNRPAKGLGNLVMTWLINGQERPDLAAKESIILRAPGTAGGSSSIGLNIRNRRDILESADAAFSVNFRADKTSEAGADNL